MWHDDILVTWPEDTCGAFKYASARTSKSTCPQFSEFDDHTLDVAAAEFDRLSVMTLGPAYMAAEDDARGLINDAISVMFGAPYYDTDTLTDLWFAEPSVHGSK